MVRLDVHAPSDATTNQRVSISAEEPTLFGRSPDPSKLPAEVLAKVTGTIEPVAIASPSVSANHVLVWRTSDEVCVEDVGSRHGTWLKLPRGKAVRVDAGVEALSLHLSAVKAHEGDGEAAKLEDAEWTDRGQFAKAVMKTVGAWLKARTIAAEVALLPRRRGNSAPAHPGQLPLASGDFELSVTAVSTMDGRWPQLLADLWKWVSRQNAIFTAEEAARAEGLILASPAIRAAHRQVLEAATRGQRLLLIGPSGSGKDGLARLYHRHTGRGGPFVARNCGMFSKDLIRSELFGAEAGAFTGAVHRIVGAVEKAHEGTLFLDEIGEMPEEVQPMLLRFLDQGEYEPLGKYGEPRHADVALVCATNKNLRAATRNGEFRADLWYRLSIATVDVPPLRERFDDVVAFLKKIELEPGGDGKGKITAYEALSPEALAMVQGHPFEGNFRELSNFVARIPRGSKAGSVDAATCRKALSEVSLSLVGSGIRGPGSLSGRGRDRDIAHPPPTPPGEAKGGPVAPPPTTASTPVADSPWAEVAMHAMAAFAEDNDKPGADTWDDVKSYVEKYLKPLLFAYLTKADSDSTARGNVQVLANRIDSDRGTAAKQMARWLERFGPR